jgi:hypothetical protein
MRVDETRHADHAFAVDCLRVRRRDGRAHGDDRAIAHMHVAAREVAKRVAHREHLRPRTTNSLRVGRLAPEPPLLCAKACLGSKMAALSSVVPASRVRRLT